MLFFSFAPEDIKALKRINLENSDWQVRVRDLVNAYWQKPLTLRTNKALHILILHLSTSLKNQSHVFQLQAVNKPDRTADEERVLNKFKQGEVVVKVLPEKTRWKQHIHTLADLQGGRIPAIRRPVNANATKKFIHKTGEIRDYQPKSATDPVKIHTHTQKCSVTLISKELHTKLFGVENLKTEVVGLAYTDEQDLDRAWLANDSWTYKHEWIGTEAEVENYKARMKTINHTNHDDFKQAIDQQPGITNEKLTKLNLDRQLAIVIGRDSVNARLHMEIESILVVYRKS